jgi:hypothetical protein
MRALEPGEPEWVGKYRLQGELGRGGMGRVFLARSPGGRLVAVKVIRAELAGDPDFRARFAREVATARTVSGIFTAPVVDADLDAAQPWLVTAYVDGPSLADAVGGDGPLPVESVVPLAAGLAEGLGAIHAAGVVHRDLKPSNVLLGSDGPRIIDFGISRAAEATELTRAGWVVGSPGFMSPEQAEGSEAGPASDIFSLGAVLTFAATGAEPFGTGPVTALLYRVVHSPPALGGLPPQLRPLVERCLAKDPGQRPTTEQILADLRTAHLSADWLPWRGVQPGARPLPADATHLAAGEPASFTVPQTAPVRDISLQPTQASAGRPEAATAGMPPAYGAPGRPPPAPATGRSARANRPRWKPVLAAGVMAGALATLAAVPISHWLTAAQSAGPAAQPPPSTAAHTGTATPAQAPATPAGLSWTRYHDPSGFSINLPAGWTVNSEAATEVHFTGSPHGFVVVVAWTRHPRPDQLADWRQQAAAKAQADPTYQQISIRRVTYRGYNAADWEFTNVYQGELTHVIDRGFIVQPGHLAYAIELYGPDATWPPVFASMWNELVSSFEPGS